MSMAVPLWKFFQFLFDFQKPVKKFKTQVTQSVDICSWETEKGIKNVPGAGRATSCSPLERPTGFNVGKLFSLRKQHSTTIS